MFELTGGFVQILRSKFKTSGIKLAFEQSADQFSNIFSKFIIYHFNEEYTENIKIFTLN